MNLRNPPTRNPPTTAIGSRTASVSLPVSPQKRTSIRCAIYTRKSTEEGLEQEYNTLQAQRDAGVAFVQSQRHEGWTALPDHYDDGGFTGGNLDRPALQRLLDDVQRRAIDVIVVYKIDRLSRSLADFAKLVELFDAFGVTFVSVTQQFNTTTSMGRLTLNILLSFAQFEREVTGERIRDKIAAAKRKGMWMGGVPPLGYDVVERKLVVNEKEATLVRDIYRRFTMHGSLTTLVRELAIEGHTTKSWLLQTGVVRSGRPIDRALLQKLLRNRLYLGEMPLMGKGESHPGQHQPIITQAAWDAVQAINDQRKTGSRHRDRHRDRHNDAPALLSGILYSPDGHRMIHSFTDKPNGRRYRYYVPYLNKRRGAARGAGGGGVAGAEGKAAKNDGGIGPLPAGEIEAVVLKEVFKALQEPQRVIRIWQVAQQVGSLKDAGGSNLVLEPRPTPRLEPEPEQSVNEAMVVVTMRQIGAVWQQLCAGEQHRLVRQLVERVQICEGGLELVWNTQAWSSFGAEHGSDVDQHPFVRESAVLRSGELV
jgi:site-specific DNA recombinase